MKPPPSARKYWTRRGVADWLAARALEESPSLIGIDHGFSFPMAYFRKHKLHLSWSAFLDDFQAHWPTDQDNIWARAFGRPTLAACGRSTGWRQVRLSFRRARLRGEVHACRTSMAAVPPAEFPGRLHFWPFDGWVFPPGETVVAEVYPSLWGSIFPRKNRNRDQHDAYSVAAWLRRTDGDGSLFTFIKPHLERDDRQIAEIEGWILSVT